MSLKRRARACLRARVAAFYLFARARESCGALCFCINADLWLGNVANPPLVPNIAARCLPPLILVARSLVYVFIQWLSNLCKACVCVCVSVCECVSDHPSVSVWQPNMPGPCVLLDVCLDSQPIQRLIDAPLLLRVR